MLDERSKKIDERQKGNMAKAINWTQHKYNQAQGVIRQEKAYIAQDISMTNALIEKGIWLQRGKYYGKNITTLPTGYIIWASENLTNIKPQLKGLLNREIIRRYQASKTDT